MSLENDVINRVAAEQRVDQALPKMTDQETLVAFGLMYGSTMPEIAARLGITRQAVFETVKRMRKYFGGGLDDY